MTEHRIQQTKILLFCGVLLIGVTMLFGGGCNDRAPRSGRTAGARPKKSNDSAFLVDTVAQGLNDLPREIVLDLAPPVPILDDIKSVDSQPVLATCGVTPAVPDGPFNYLAVPKGNAGFRRVGVRPGDIVRYFVSYDQEGAEHGYAQMGYIELVVRRLDVNNPDNALIIEGGLNGPLPEPQRIEVWRFSDKRTNEIRQRINRYEKRPKTLIGWEPSPDESALLQLLERVNQWLRNFQGDSEAWQMEPLLNELPKELLKAKSLSKSLSQTTLSSGQFDTVEARQLQQAIWFRDVSRWAAGEAVSPVDVASALFDWTIRNVQLVASGKSDYVFQPWQILMYGHGTAEQRAWVFAELCRQQQLDVVMLSAGGKSWLPALLYEGEFYLFDTQLGLPVENADPSSVATLSEVVAAPDLLAQFEIDGEAEYPITAEHLQQITAWLIASPLQLAKRASLLEQVLEGDDYVVLAANTRQIAAATEKMPPVSQVRLWPIPFESVLAETSVSAGQRVLAGERFKVFAQLPRLWKARALHFQGTKAIPMGDRNDPLAQPDRGHQQALSLYQNSRVRPSNAIIARLEPSKKVMYQRSKDDASYWIGLLSYDLGKYKVAEDWLAKRSLEARPQGPWADGARYNLARTYEAMGELPAAIELLEADNSPQRLGNLLRAQQLQQRLEAELEASQE